MLLYNTQYKRNMYTICRYHYVRYYVHYKFSSNIYIYMYVGATKTGIRNYSLYYTNMVPTNTRPFVVNCIICTYLPTYMYIRILFKT